MQWRYFALCFIVVIISDLTFTRAQYDDYEYPDDDYETDPDPCITGLTVSGSSGTIQSQDYPSQYLTYENCNWTIRVEDGMRIAVKFSLKFSIETNGAGGCTDVLSLNDNGEILQLCGTETPDSFVSSTNELSINFMTNDAVQEVGFSFNWTAIDPATLPIRSHIDVSDDEGMISSPNYPNSYGNFENTVWRLNVTSSKYIHVNFDSTFGMESGNGACPYDSLKIYEGSTIQSSKLLRTVCSLPTEALVFKTNEITLHFSSDSMIKELGFSLSYKTIDPVECGSPIMSSGTAGTVTSPYYPISYEDNLDCMWRISVPEGQRIAVRFNPPFNIKHDGTCGSDMLQLFDGAATSSQQHLEDFCGAIIPRGFLTTTNELTVVFKSGFLAGKAVGFSFNWTAEAECSNSQFQCWDGSCVDLSTKCDGTIDCPNDSADEAECVFDPSLATCGIQSVAPEFFREHRIIGGSYARQGSWPWQVSLITSGNPFCGGVLISDEWVLSAAHCYLKGNNITAVMGDHNITVLDATREQRITVDQAVIHPGYAHSSLQGLLKGSDLALLHLSTAIVKTEWVQPICLPNSPISEGETIVTTGWGRKSLLSTEGSDVLRQVRLLPTSESQCEKSFGSFSSGAYPSGILCLTSPGPGMGPCQGDSGSPAMRVKDQRWEVIGIVSFSSQCGSTGLPSYFTDVLAFSSYISKYFSSGKQTVEQKRFVINAETGTLTVPSSDGGSSPNYPQLIFRQWFITVPENKRITVRFSNSFNIEFGGEFCPYDYLVIRDGLTTTSNMYLNRRFCGSRPPPDFETSSNGVIIEFYSDASYEETGFSITWSTNDDCKPGEFRCGNRSCISASLRCDGNFDCSDGMDEITCKQISTASTQCGVQEVAPEVSWYPLIAGGSNSVEGSWPWQAALYEADSGSFVCGATLINNRWALTAASCTSRTKNYKVSLGDYDIGYASMNEQRFNVQEATRYLTYNGPGDGDIAILRLSESLTYTDWIKPICLPSSGDSNKPAQGTICMLTGWGVTAVGSGLSGPRILQQVPLTVMSGPECLASFQKLSLNSFATTLPSNLICAGHEDKRTTACMRDTGGPLQCLMDGAWVQYGVLTLGDTCDDLAFFERVSDYEGWIEETIARKQCDGLQILEESSGSIAPPTIDGTYLTMLSCSWLIRAQQDMLLEITFDYFDIESHATCEYDRLLVYDGGDQNSRLYMDEILCGKNTTIAGFESNSNEVLVLFTTDSSTNFAGFKLNWKAVESCQSDLFRCGDRSCIEKSKKCDGRPDCSDSKDEVECAHSTNVCGKQYVAPKFLWSSRIYGGSYAKKGSWPWQAYILDSNDDHQCGASILSEEWILTAAHCTYLRPYFSVGVGGYDQTDKVQDQVIRIDIDLDVYRHSGYNDNSLESGFDIALIKLPTPITLNNYTQPICLPTSNVNPISLKSNCVATGWGLTKINSIASKILRQIRLPPVNSYEICEKANKAAYDEDILFCAGVQGGRDTCRGDSGGPVVCFEDNNWYQYGIVSYGTDGLYCGRAGGVGFYTTVSYFVDWIKNVTKTTFPEPAPLPTSTIAQTTSVPTVSVGLNATGITNTESSTAGQSTATTGTLSTTSGSVTVNPKFYHRKFIALILIYYVFCFCFL